MKIELGESLFYSWLRHVKKCKIVQTNWKSSEEWDKYNTGDLKKLYAEALKKFGACLVKDNTTKKTTDVWQFLKQAEIDVIGKNDEENKVYAVDVAFHSATCNYSGGKSNDNVIAKKIIRAAFCLYGYFNVKQGEIIFATPKIGDTSFNKVDNKIKQIKTFLDEKGFNFDIRCICNKAFYDDVVCKVVKLKNNSDTAELFMRAYLLYDISCKYGEPCKPISVAEKTQNKVKTVPAGQLPVGKLVQTELFKILQNKNVKPDEIKKFLKKEYSKEVFGLSYPLLSEEKVKKYYSVPIKIYRKLYYVCSEWTERNRNKLNGWLKKYQN